MRQLVAVRASEIKIVRVICKGQGCGVVTELPADQLTVRFHGDPAVCPHCRTVLCSGTTRPALTPFAMLAVLSAEASRKDAKFDLEFVFDRQ